LVLLEWYGAHVAGFVAVDTLGAGFAVVTLASLLATTPGGALAQEDVELDEPLPERVLFIGNSHTERQGGLDWLVGNFVAAEDPLLPFEGQILTEGGATLEYHWNNGARQVIRDGDFDTVVLQGYLPGSETQNAEPFLEHARLFDEAIREAGAKTVFYMTWPRGFNDWSDLEDVMEAHRVVEAELDAKVAPAAVAFELAEAERPDLLLVDPDHVHATPEGAYLAAATVYATLFDRSPEGLPYSFGVDPDDAAFMERIAWEALTAWREGATAADVEAPETPS
jgi:hypothetical protein